MLFVNDHEPKILERCENSRTRTDNNAGVSASDPTPFVKPLAGREIGMKDSDLIAKDRSKPSRKYGRECDLGDEHQCGLAVIEGMPHRTNVNLGLAAAGYAVKKESPVFATFQAFDDLCVGKTLLGVQDEVLQSRKLRVCQWIT